MKGKWTGAVAFGLMALAFGPALYWRLSVDGVANLIITPSGERLMLALAIFTPLIPATALTVAAVRRTLQLWVLLPLVGLVLLGIACGGALMTVFAPPISFADRYLRTEPVEPEELHLYQGGALTCTLEVYAAPRGALFGRRVATKDFDCDNRHTVRARWQADAGVEIVGAGEPTTLHMFPPWR